MEVQNLAQLPTATAIENILEHQLPTKLAWRRSSAKERINRLTRLEDWIQENKDSIRLALQDDFKKPEMETDMTEIFPVLSEIRYARRHLKGWMKKEKVSTPLTLLGTSSWVQWEPKGTALIIAPWNYPFNLQLVPLVSCLAAGCTAVLKPSELTPNTANLLQRLVEEVFTPDEVMLYQGGKEVSQELLSQPFDHIFFTGSPQVGKIVMEAAAENLTSVTLELGGKSPAIVCPDTKLTTAAQRIALGKWVNAGQTCIAPDYLLVHESVAEEFIGEMKTVLDNMYGATAEERKATDEYARVINDKHFSRLQKALSEAVEQDAQVRYGGSTDGATNYIEPTVITNVPENCSLLQEEIFGPILPIKTYRTNQEVYDYINSKPKPLALYLFSSSTEQRKEILAHTSSGGVCINDCSLHYLNPSLPFGGVNFSGIGKAHGHWGFKAFSNAKGVLKQREGYSLTGLFSPPFSPLAKTAARLILKFL
jgi:aldehyde dehydrogenase (NAD+)